MKFSIVAIIAVLSVASSVNAVTTPSVVNDFVVLGEGTCSGGDSGVVSSSKTNVADCAATCEDATTKGFEHSDNGDCKCITTSAPSSVTAKADTKCYIKAKTSGYDIALPEMDCSADESADVTCKMQAKATQGDVVKSTLLNDDCKTANSDKDLKAGVTDTTIAATATAQEHTFNIDLVTMGKKASYTVVFCIKTEVHQGTNNGPVLATSFNKVSVELTYTNSFTVTSITTKEKKELTSLVDVAQTFKVTAKRCDKLKNEISSPPLQLGNALFICLTSNNNAVITSVTVMNAKKTGLNAASLNFNYKDTLNNGNVFEVGLNTKEVLVGANLPPAFFYTTNPITVTGTVEMNVAGRRYLARVLQESDNAADFDLDVDVVEISDSSANYVSICFTALAGMMAAFMVIA